MPRYFSPESGTSEMDAELMAGTSMPSHLVLLTLTLEVVAAQ